MDIVLSLLTVLLLSLIFLAALRDWLNARAVDGWPVAKGRITQLQADGRFEFSYEVDRAVYTSHYADYAEYYGACHAKRRAARKDPSKKGTVACPGGLLSLRFLYGIKYRLLADRDPIRGKERVVKIAERYTEGDEVLVPYEPGNPAVAVLDKAVPGSFTVVLVLASVIWGGAAGGIVLDLIGVTIFDWIIPLLFFLGILYVMKQIAFAPDASIRLAEQSATWPKTRGEVFASYVTEGYKTLKKPVVHFRYEAKGKTYASRDVYFGMGDMKQEAAQALVETYPEGKEVPVSYKPDDPGIAVIEPGAKYVGLIIAARRRWRILFFIFLLVGLFTILAVILGNFADY
jgi:hypothetical protein